MRPDYLSQGLEVEAWDVRQVQGSQGGWERRWESFEACVGKGQGFKMGLRGNELGKGWEGSIVQQWVFRQVNFMKAGQFLADSD